MNPSTNSKNHDDQSANEHDASSSENDFYDEEYDSLDDQAENSDADDNTLHADPNNKPAASDIKDDAFEDLSRHEYDQKLSLVVKALGYRSDPKGVCAGFSGMGAQAILIRDVPTFAERAYLIKTVPYPIFRDLRLLIIKSLNEIKSKAQSKFSSNDELFDINALSMHDRKQYEEYLHQLLCEQLTQNVNYKTKITKITHNQADLLTSMATFCAGIDVIQQPYLKRFMTFFAPIEQIHRQDLLVSLNLVQSILLENNGGIKKLMQYTGVYSEIDLQSLLTSLRDHLKTADEPCVFMLENTKHYLTLGYEPLTDEWIYINSIGPVILRTHNEKEIAKCIMESFSQNGITTFSTSIFTTSTNEHKGYEKINAWTTSDAWQALHDPKKDRFTPINAVDSDGYSWLFAAIEHGIDTTFIQTLIDQGADINQYNSYHETTPIFHAVENRLYDHAELLLKNGCDTDFLSDQGTTVFENAVALNDARMVRLLLKYGVKVELDTTRIIPQTQEIYALIANAEVSKPIIDQALAQGSKSPTRIKILRELYETMLDGETLKIKTQIENYNMLEDLATRLTNDSDREDLYAKYLITSPSEIENLLNSYHSSDLSANFKRLKNV